MNDRVIRNILTAATCVSFAVAPLADDIVIKSGKVLKNAEIVSIESNEVTIRYEGGTERFPASVIPDDALRHYRDQEFRRKADEVEKLKQDLARQEKELKQLKEDNERLRREERRAATATAPAKPAPSRPLTEVQSVRADDLIDANDLVLYYKSDPSTADPRFRGKEFRLRGVVAGFSPKLFIRRYDVGLESPEKSMNIICKFGYLDEWQAVYTTDRGRRLIAKVPRAEISLLKIGQPVTIQVRFGGLKDGELEFDRCALVRP